MSGDRDLEILPDADAVARRGARVVAEAVRAAAGERGRFAFGVSGGRTPGAMFGHLAAEDVPWGSVGIWQVDERIAPEGDPDRNLTQLMASLPAEGIEVHPMPVMAVDLEEAAAAYAAELPDTFDLVHLGLGDDGHTASLVPGDAVLDVTDRDVAITQEYRGRRRMTLTYPVLDRARRVLWLITGPDKARVLPRLLSSDPSIPAGRVRAASQLVLADEDAAAEMGDGPAT